MPSPSYLLYQLHIELGDIVPAVWRRILVPANITLSELHPVIQAAMGWQDQHFYLFETPGGKGYSNVEVIEEGFEEWRDDSTVTLQQVLTPKSPAMLYLYDFGDGWHHQIRLEKSLPLIGGTTAEPICLAGQNACPPESCGGVAGYQHLIEVMRHPEYDEYADLSAWLGADTYDASYFDQDDTNTRLQLIHHYSPLLIHDEIYLPFLVAQPELDQLLEHGSFDAKTTHQAFIDQFLLQLVEDENEPLIDLPMPPEQLHQLLYQPFDAPDVVQFNPAAANPENAPILALFNVLAECVGDKGIKLTQKGNLPLAVIRKMVEAVPPEQRLHDRVMWEERYRSEEDVPPVHYTRLLATVGGLCRVVKGQLVLTKQGHSITAKQDWASAFHTLMKGLFTKFNWAYVDNYPDTPLIRMTAPVLLHRLSREPDGLNSRAAADYLIALFPELLEEVDDGALYAPAEEVVMHAILHRWISLLGLAGLVHFEPTDGNAPFGNRFQIRISPLANEYLHWRPTSF